MGPRTISSIIGSATCVAGLPTSAHPERVREETDEALAQRHGQLVQAQQSGVAFAPLNAADVGPVESGMLRQNLLRPATRFPRFAHALAECLEDCLV